MASKKYKGNLVFFVYLGYTVHVLLIYNLPMTTETFSFSSTLSSAWRTIKTHIKFLAPAVLATGVLMIVLQLLQNASESSVAGSIIVTIITVLVGIAITLGWANVMLKLVRGSKATWIDFKTHYTTWGHYVVAQILFSILVLIAFGLVMGPLFLLMVAAIFLDYGTIYVYPVDCY
jgi:hypothetical protein